MQNLHQYESNNAQARRAKLQWKSMNHITSLIHESGNKYGIDMLQHAHTFVSLFVNWHNRPRDHSLHNTRTNAELTSPNGGLW
jgi:hypothetical protein